jgi:hypothetical protein
MAFRNIERSRARERGLSHLAPVLVAVALWMPDAAWPHGAVAVGHVDPSGRDGIAMGASWNAASEEEARVLAMQVCLDSRTVPFKARAMCQVVHTFRRSCVALVTDPKQGGTGWGWAVERDEATAEKKAHQLCAAKSCVTTVLGCDVAP